MKDIFARINDFLFDFLGLILPGTVFAMLFFLPLFVVDLEGVKSVFANDFFVHANETLLNTKDGFLGAHPSIIYTGIVLIIYLIGHSLKVFSKIQYRLFESVINRSIKVWIKKLIGLNATIDWNVRWFLKLPFVDYVFKIIQKVLSFSHKDYFPEAEYARKSVAQKIKEKYDPNFKDQWSEIYRFSTKVIAQEDLKSKSYSYLAKYNFYRSLSFLFLINFFWLHWIQDSYEDYLHINFIKIGTVANFLLWFTFHEKFRRYWVLCGNETLMTIYYYLNKTVGGKQLTVAGSVETE